MPVSFAERRKQAESEGLIGSDRFKLKEGNNRIRLMSECLAHASVYNGSKTFKWLCYIIDRTDGKVKLFFMPHKVYRQIEDLQLSEDYAFADVPMPYDVTIKAEGAGTMQVKYTVIPAKKETPIKAVEHQDLAKQTSLDAVRTKLLEKAEKNAPPPAPPVDEHGDPVDVDDIPF